LQSDELLAYRYDGFWQAMDTFKDRQALEQLYSDGDAPWEVWKRQEQPGSTSTSAPIELRVPNRSRLAR
jgi:NDP-sugar pyrophosphorylase family protein